MATVISGPQIELYRLLSIKTALNLQAKTGLKHSSNAPVIAARQILAAAGVKPKKVIKGLAEQFNQHIQKTYPAPAV
jgi:hypothetical protein